MSQVDILGYAAGAVTTLTFLPQVIKTARERSAKGISLMMFLIAAINEVMWIAYAFLLDPVNWVIVLTNGILLVFSLTMIYFKYKFKDDVKEFNIGD